MEKKAELLAAAREVFAEKGYKAAGISDIAKRSHMAVGSFYKYYESKEAVFLDVYVAENSRIREETMRRVDWQDKPEAVVEQLFAVTFELISPNKILAEWNKPGISQLLHDYYRQEEGRAANAFHRFLIQTFSQRLQEEGFSKEKTAEIMKVYDLIYYIDMHVTEQEFPGYFNSIETLVKYFVKGIFSK
ncbi:TetR/AcrR family transcriptional regulator [Streptococcus panodentis]|uniref:TetR family transcriptional regulator n=1 Tax=Streptococcus panodentis TaxID=1581472 RepID=A0ABS5AX81_9STRE|nr:TetR/AcrR family transcriptional regulator [Streptococcus panodentis]MBP2620861.1 TetR family transcriptional regulator [Streptococcus panodentis]